MILQIAHKTAGPRRVRSALRTDHGFALMLVIVVLLLASFLASQLILQVKTELTISYNIKSRVIGNFLADAGVNLGIFRLVDKPREIPDFGEEEEWETFFEGFEYEMYLPKGRVTYYAVNETGKIDLNKSPRMLVELFLEYHLSQVLEQNDQLDVDQEEQIAIIADSLLDWRDNDDLHRINGAESETYEALAEPYIARNGRIEDPSEFFLINGTDTLVGRFNAIDVFSVYNTKGKINFNSLTPAMLEFVVGGDKDKIEAYREAKKEFNGKLSAGMAAEIIGEERFGILRPYLTFSSRNNRYFYIVGIGQYGVDEEMMGERDNLDEDQKQAKIPGTRHSVLIRKEGARFTFMAFQERYS